MNKLKMNFFSVLKKSMILTALISMVPAFAGSAPNARATTNVVASPRNNGAVSSSAGYRAGGESDASTDIVVRSANVRTPSTVSRAAAMPMAGAVNTATARSANVKSVVDLPTVSRAATVGASVSRSATAMTGKNSARSATANVSNASVSRAGIARATAVFDDIEKIGGGYATCRDAYATCMDQFCAKANDTYRRCFCSDKYIDFSNTEDTLDSVKLLLMRFEDNNLNAVDKTAQEVNAMYSATEGENAIKSDTSGAADMLAEIGDLLSGKTKVSQNTSGSLGIIDFNISGDIGDVWGDSASGIFGGGGTDLSLLEGQALYSDASKQCIQMISDSCENEAVFNMARSSYNILITQDCNAYAKVVDSQREVVENTVRTAEKYLREARLEEYRSHNSADVNECMDRVKTAMLTDAACGPNYNRCLDYTGLYVSQTTGEPIYSTRLFELADVITLDGVSSAGSAAVDFLADNSGFNNFLDSKKMFATTALDSCRDLSDIVWNEFKRTAMIEIAQAQDAKIEEVKMSCVSTMKECYDTQSGALKSFDDTSAQMAGAVSAYAAKAMCQDKVTACAALYDDANCSFGNDGKLDSKCGLAALLDFVNVVDDVRIGEGCATAIDSRLTELCTPSTGDVGYPWGCRAMNLGTLGTDSGASATDGSLAKNIYNIAVNNCAEPGTTNLSEEVSRQVKMAFEDISEELAYQMANVCEDLGGFWLSTNNSDFNNSNNNLLDTFYDALYGDSEETDESKSWGRCIENTTKVQCESFNVGRDETEGLFATYDAQKDECVFTTAWFEQQCSFLGRGYFDSGVCHIVSE